MESSAPSPDPRRAVGLVLLGTVRAPKRTAVGRLLARLGEWGLVDPPLIRVSASRAAGEVGAGASDDELELGASGDPGEDVAAAARALGSRFGCELLIVVDGDSDADGEERLGLLDRYALRAPLELDAIVGTIVRRSETEAELGRGPFLVPTGLVERLVRPPEGAIEAPQRSPPSDPRREGPYEVRTPFGERTRGVGVAVIDLRVVRALRDARVGLASIGEQEREALLGLPGLRSRLPKRPKFEFWLDGVEIPEQMAHGEIAEMRLRGWVVGAPMPDHVELFVDDRVVARGSVRVPRPDVLISRPELRVETCGFGLSAALGPFAPGAVRVRWSVVGGGAGGELGTVRVARTHRIGIHRVLVPARGSARAAQWIRIDGSVSASAEVTEIEVVFGGRRVPVVRSEPATPSDYALPSSCRFVAATQISDLGEADSASLLVRSRDAASGTDHCVRRVALVRDPDAVVPAVLERREIGCRDPVTGRTRVRISGVAFGLGATDRVVLRSDGRDLAEARIAPLDPSEAGGVCFELDAESEQLAVGGHRFEIVAARADGSRESVAVWSEEVLPESTRVVEAAARLEPGEGVGDPHHVVVEGKIEDSDRVESLALAIDGQVHLRLGAEWLRHDETGNGPDSGRNRCFRFDGWRALEPGPHEIEIRARRGAVEVPIWRGAIEASASAPVEGAIGISCAELDRLLREDPAPVWSRLILDGRLVRAPRGASVRLRLDGRETAEVRAGDDGTFHLEVDPGAARVLEGRLEVEFRGEPIASPPIFRIAPRPLRVRRKTAAAVERLLGRLAPDRAAFAGFSAEAALTALFERDVGSIGSYSRAISRLDRRLREAERRPGEVVCEPPPPSGGRAGERLRVLFVAWEPPCSLHGGGVAIRNLLRGLGDRFEITLLHTVAPGEEGLSEEARPWVSELFPVRREWRLPTVDADFGVPASYAWSYSPLFRAAIEGELASGRYDLFNGDFLRTALHVDVSDHPSVGVAHEVESYAAVSTAPERFVTPEEAGEWLGVLLRTLHFEALFAPSRFSEFATLTMPEAEFLVRLLPGRRLFVSPIPIDTDALAQVALRRSPAPAPVLLFVGNFIHPPNRAAAQLLAEKIAPAVHDRRPDARFVIAGAGPPPELTACEGRHGVHVPGFVPDLSALTSIAAAFLAPIFEGAGMRVKLLEALASGCPVVSTPLGFSGIGGEAGTTWLEATSVDGFVDAALRLIDDSELAGRLSEEGRRFVERRFGIAAQAERRERIWRAALEASAVRE